MPTVFVSVRSAKFTFAIFLRDKTRNVEETFCLGSTKGPDRGRGGCELLQFPNIIEGGMSVEKSSCSEKERVPTTTRNDVLLSEKDSVETDAM